MADFETALKGAASAVLKRELTDEERAEFRDLADTLGMGSVEDYLYMLMIFKRNEDRINGKLDAFENAIDGKLDAIAELEKKINETLERSITRILKEGAAKIGAEMGEHVAADAKGVLSAFGEYHSIRGQITLVCLICVISAIAYWLGAAGFLESLAPDGRLEAILLLPAGWCVFLGGAAYTFLWVGDHWGAIKKSALYKILLGAQILCLVLLAAALL